MKVHSIRPTEDSKACDLPLFEYPISAGFPSPADDLIDKKLDLNEALIKHPAATFFVRVQGDSMTDVGILNEDLLVVDRSISPQPGQVVVAVINGEFTVKKIEKEGKDLFLKPENPKYSRIKISKEMDFMIWGVVTHAIHSL